MNGNRIALFGVLVGLAGAVLLGVFVAGGRPVKTAAAPTIPALIANEALAPGLTGEEIVGKVREVQVPHDLAPPRRVTDLAGVAGHRVARTVGQGELLTLDQFVAHGPQSGGVVVAQGFEAVTVEADPAPGLEGYATPGSKVNVYATLGAPEPTTRLILAQTEVLAVTPGTLTGESQEPAAVGAPETIVLLLQVPAPDVPRLVEAAHTDGALWFTLPSPLSAGTPQEENR